MENYMLDIQRIYLTVISSILESLRGYKVEYAR